MQIAKPAQEKVSSPTLGSRVGTLVVGQTVSSAATFLMMAGLARILSVPDFGRVGYAFNLYFLLVMFLSFGIPNSVVVLRNRLDREVIGELNRFFLGLLAISLPFAVAGVVAVKAFQGISISTSLAVVVAGYLGLVVPHVIAICQADGRWKDINHYQIIANIVRMAVVLAVAFAMRNSPLAVLWASGIGIGVAALYTGVRERALLWVAKSLRTLKPRLADVRNLGITNCVIVVATRADFVVAGFLLSVSDLGAYSAAYTLVSGMGMVQSAIMSVTLHDAASTGSPGLVFRRATQMLPLIALAIACVFLFSGIALPLLFGAKYAAAAIPFRYLGTTVLLGIFFAPLESHLSTFATHAQLALKAIQLFGFIALAMVMPRTLAGIAQAVMVSRAIGWAWSSAYFMKGQVWAPSRK